MGPELRWVKARWGFQLQLLAEEGYIHWERTGTVGGNLFLLAFKKNLLEKDLKLWYIVMETPERNICILLEVKVKRMKL